MDDRDRPNINISSIRVAGVGGFGMVVVVCAMVLEMPEIRAFAIVSGTGGAVIAAALIGYRRWVRPEPPHGPTLMLTTATSPVQKRDRNELDTKSQFVPILSPH
jgi:hypothetical protein